MIVHVKNMNIFVLNFKYNTNMMKLILSFLLLTTFSFSSFGQIEKIVGRWKTIDDKEKVAKSIVNIFKATDGKYYGKIEKLFKDPNKLCTECEGANKDKPIMGMIIVNNMTEKDGKLTGGTILDPNNGKVYRCNISLDDSNGERLSVRGSLDRMGWIGRSQIWLRVK
jgi:uncharacterized protein (DUF2147 family)